MSVPALALTYVIAAINSLHITSRHSPLVLLSIGVAEETTISKVS